jgi:hypothetical protein
MNSQQLRNILIDKISGIEDVQYLKAIKTILETSNQPEKPYQLIGDQKKKVLSGLDQLKAGKTISNEELEKDEDEWLKE